MTRLLPGSSSAIVAENIRTLRQQGYSETKAIQEAHARAKAGSDSERPLPASDAKRRRFVVVTKDFSGLGWAKALKDEGEQVVLAVKNPEKTPEDKRQFEAVAEDWIDVVDLDRASASMRSSNTYWLFAENHFPDMADGLRKAGQRVWGTGKLAEKLEHDRQYAVDVAAKAGLKPPETHEFSDREAGLTFLDDHADTAYVFKPDDSNLNYMTFVPVREDDADANRETYNYLCYMKQEPGTYVLQERVHGIELNVEVWLDQGEPYFACIGLEAKRKNVGDLGEMSGCAGDVIFPVPVDAPVVKQTIGKMGAFYKAEAYTGFADVNVILLPDGSYRFLEVCNRFGYNAHISLLLGLLQGSVADLVADLADGKTEGMAGRFTQAFASSLTIFLDHPREGLPVHVDPDVWDLYYPFDGYMDHDVFLLTGYSSEVGVLVQTGNTPEAALRAGLEAMEREAVSIPDMHYRTDLMDRDYPNAILSRYDALRQKGLV